MSVATSVLLISASSYALLCVLIFLVQERLLFRPTRPLKRTPADVGLEFIDEWFDTATGERVHGWRVPSPNARARVLFLHGNEGNIADRLESLKVLHALGLEVLAIDYPGYGQSTGDPSEQSCDRAARHCLDVLRADAPSLPVVVWGRSMGGGVATSLLGRPGIAALVLEASFTSIPDVAQLHYPWLPARWMSRVKFPSKERLHGVQVPVLVVHSNEDEVIPFHHGEALVAAAGEQGTFVAITGTHGEGYFTSGEAYRAPLGSFLDTHLTAQTPGA
jgi:uncharacterized protein